MKFYTTKTDIRKLSGDALVVFTYQDADVFVSTHDFQTIDRESKHLCSQLLKEEHFIGSLGATFVIQTKHILSYKKVIVVGLGKASELTMRSWQFACASLARRAKTARITSLVFPLPTLTQIRAMYGAVVGLGLGSYTFLIHKSKKNQQEEHDIETVVFVGKAIDQQDILRGVIVTEATRSVRDLVNEPPSVTTPTYLSNHAKRLSKSNIKVTVLGKREIKKLGMQGLLAVSQGSHEEPKFITLSYKGGGKKTITLVGKGITFDSGGLSLKPQSGLETMKCDMAGAGVVLGVFQALAKLKPRIHVVGLIAACENMPGGGSIKPGDVVRSMNGKTIEIVNTDAEGRVILADALSYAEKYIRSTSVIDLATLTGACVVALGEQIAGVFSDSDSLAQSILQYGDQVGEVFWRMPITPMYKDQLQSDIADVRNVSKTRYGGAINGALFLSEFAPKNVPWAHLDIAGPAFAEKDVTISPYGGTGFGVQTLLRFIEEEARKT